MSQTNSAVENHRANQQRLRWHSTRLVAMLVLALGTAAIANFVAPSPALAGAMRQQRATVSYYCSENPGGHCYGYNEWDTCCFWDWWQGASTSDYVAPLTCNGCWNGSKETGFVDNEMWFADNDCANGPCWVEAGYSTYSDSSGTATKYFWAENSSYGGYYEDPLITVPSGDYGYNLIDQITLNSGTSDQWTVFLESQTWRSWNTATGNSMTPGVVRVGQELSGAGSYIHAAQGKFNFNSYLDNGTWSDFNWDGSLAYDNPPYVGYTVPPSQSSTGGTIWTSCC